MWFTRLAINRPILIWMALLAIAILGVQGYFRLPAELNPKTDIPTLVVTAIYPGAGPPEVETGLTIPLEEAARTVGGVKGVFSSSQANVAILSVDFAVGTNLDVAAAELQRNIEAARPDLPAETRAPVVRKLDINAQPILYLGFASPSTDLRRLRALMDDVVRPRIERVPGVASIQVIGGERREIRVAVDSGRLAQFGLTIADVVNSLKASGRDIPSGGITQGKEQTEVRLSGAFTSLATVRETQILLQALAQREAMRAQRIQQAGGGPSLPSPALTVGDVADVTDATAERTEINRINGGEGISLVLTKAPDANTVRVAEGVSRVLEQLKGEFPPDLQRVTVRDDAQTVGAALEDVNFSLVLGAFLAMGVILLFLHNLRGTLIVSIAIPACVVATFLVIYIAGFTLNQMTLLALSLSVGILVDDSIVVLESITRHLQQGEPPREAALNGRAEIGFADLTTTLVDVVVFVPIAFMGGIVGGFFKQFGLTIATATLFSLVVSFSITPMLASRWYRQGESLVPTRGLFLLLERLYRMLEARYHRMIAWALRHRAIVMLSGVAALGLIFFVSFRRLGFEFMPGTDQGQISVTVEMPPGTSLSATDAAARRVDEAVRADKDVAATVTNIGQILGGFGSIPQQGAQFAQINVRLAKKRGAFGTGGQDATRARSDGEITTELRRKLEPLGRELGGRVTAAAVRSVQGISTPVILDVLGGDLEQLTVYATRLRDEIARVPGVIDPDLSVRPGRPELRVKVDPQRAARFNMPVAQVGSIVRDSLAGSEAATLRRDGQEMPVRVRLAETQRNTPDDLREIPVGADVAGNPVVLGDVATISRESGPSAISRRNGLRQVTVTAALAPGYALGNVQQEIQARLDALREPGIKVEWGGEAQTLNENAYFFATALILAVILVYIVMASLFNNLGTPFVIMFTLPMALIGALGALVLTGETMSLVAAIGVIMLVGLMGRNAILLLDYANTLRERGTERNAALMEAGSTRLRPILMTTTATVVGMLPVALRIGEASEIRAPMAIVVIGGLLISTVLTLVVIPVLYSLYDDLTGGRKQASTSLPVVLEAGKSTASTPKAGS